MAYRSQSLLIQSQLQPPPADSLRPPNANSSSMVLSRTFILCLLLAAAEVFGFAEKLRRAVEGAHGIDAVFDYVVAGGGTAGVTVAARLAEHGFSVALIEAGDFYTSAYPLAQMPGVAVIGTGANVETATPIDWKFVARDIPGANHRDIHYPRGKCVGGSSASNLMIYTRPDTGTMARWAELVQDSSYTFDRVLPFFQRTAAFTPPENEQRPSNASASSNPAAFAEGEPLQVSYPVDSIAFSSWMESGLHNIGIDEAQDFNSGTLLGSQYCSLTIHPSERIRSSSWAAFGQNGDRISTMKLYRTTMAKKILFDSKKRATGVEVRTENSTSTYTLHAKREVIVSAGVFHSPQLLMVSGIGPTDALSEHNIQKIANLPGVGQNMWDHVMFGPSYRVAMQTLTRVATDPAFLAQQVVEWTTGRQGLMTNPGADYLAFENIPEYLRGGFSEETNRNLSWFPLTWPEAEVEQHQPTDGAQYATILGVLVAPTSRGSITITSDDTEDLPIINPNWLATESDAQVSIAIYKRIREAFQAIDPIAEGDEYFPGSQFQTNEQLLEVIRDTVMTIYHAACTCKMGTRNDPMAVVDNRARVFGVKGLRVVDASAFPLLPPGHPQSVVYMLAEKIAADIIGGSR
ncbi:putative GMC oxidoreductase [Aspergillus homomorphus CBS 101889]|uniref:Putative GMC oxidoreductase n=1 Tax=Aspergillus homomorphus (strain CBS 101889) TaxID=1450537 RepID=A0A395I0Q5_ASPHC|nr:putative GMC oxidoreductase [Aspergillus homomorphus CBS 101889]RAL13507.1 putative GMC oxidoreductase [Aspergillus homomorphus CBS 101889]